MQRYLRASNQHHPSRPPPPGPGTWTLEMAEAYPHSSFVGTDISAVFPESIKPKNCHFEIANIGAHLPYPDDQFDYLHQRILTLGLTAAEWDNVCNVSLKWACAI